MSHGETDMTTATYNLKTTKWKFDGTPTVNFAIRFIHGTDERAYPDGLKFGYTITINNTPSEQFEYPPSNITIRELSKNRLFHYRAEAVPDDTVTLDVWATNANLTKHAKHEFVIPRPEQPYPSWEWQDGAWIAPSPYPEGDGMYSWDEDTLDWIEVD
jgi:hypothetical protein